MLPALLSVTMRLGILWAALTDRRAGNARPWGWGGHVVATAETQAALAAAGEGLPPHRRPVMLGSVATVRTHQQEIVELPRDKSSAQKTLRRYGMKGFSVSLIEDPAQVGPYAVVRVYCWTRPRLSSDNTMKKRAMTVVFGCSEDDEEVRHFLVPGWDCGPLAQARLAEMLG
jgi:hypothetical protein